MNARLRGHIKRILLRFGRSEGGTNHQRPPHAGGEKGGQFIEAQLGREVSRIGRIEGVGHRISKYWRIDARNDLRFATGGLPGVRCRAGAVPVLLTGIYGGRAGVGCSAARMEPAMGLLSWLTGRSSASRRVDAILPGPGLFAVDVVGESNYQHALAVAAGGRTADGCEKIVDVVLVLEDSNPHDSKAVQALIGGSVCGYLSRENARAYRKQLRKAGHPNITASCKAMIVGGWDRGGGDCGHFGLRLDLPHDG